MPVLFSIAHYPAILPIYFYDCQKLETIVLLFTPGLCIHCKVRKKAYIKPRGNLALCRRQTSNRLNSVTVSAAGANSNAIVTKAKTRAIINRAKGLPSQLFEREENQ